jgi:hypothetical protein
MRLAILTLPGIGEYDLLGMVDEKNEALLRGEDLRPPDDRNLDQKPGEDGDEPYEDGVCEECGRGVSVTLLEPAQHRILSFSGENPNIAGAQAIVMMPIVKLLGVPDKLVALGAEIAVSIVDLEAQEGEELTEVARAYQTARLGQQQTRREGRRRLVT